MLADLNKQKIVYEKLQKTKTVHSVDYISITIQH